MDQPSPLRTADFSRAWANALVIAFEESAKAVAEAKEITTSIDKATSAFEMATNDAVQDAKKEIAKIFDGDDSDEYVGLIARIRAAVLSSTKSLGDRIAELKAMEASEFSAALKREAGFVSVEFSEAIRGEAQDLGQDLIKSIFGEIEGRAKAIERTTKDVERRVELAVSRLEKATMLAVEQLNAATAVTAQAAENTKKISVFEKINRWLWQTAGTSRAPKQEIKRAGQKPKSTGM